MDAPAPESPLEPFAALEDGLRIAFGPPSPPSPPPSAALSVLARLAPDGVDFSKVVLLRDEPTVGEPPVNPPLAPAQRRAEGRYQLLGEIARGGVGVVLKGRDVDLGRDVAMKVLRDEHGRNPDVIQRFVEEAQIGGQLQHPGIVPVYEMGVREDRRPYFTMKLIKGRTLAALLGERADPTQDRRRFLSVFESVCQTMAYAHARGVIHRDLKPANVMVGAFGEVLVVDWGMGKVLTSGGAADERGAKKAAETELGLVATVRSEGTGSHSVAGSVMGTPRYMPPEQARGAIEQLDERADVFALGAILCEILTGQPPHTASSDLVLAQAARGEMDEAFQRLDAANVEAELVVLAKACLAPAAAARPRDAAAVAKAISAHLASVEERAATARMDAAEARVKAQEERKRRRLSLALSGAVLGLVLLGGGGWLLIEQDRRSRAEDASRAVAEAVDEATTLRANAVVGTDASLWTGAVSAARRAQALSRDADEATRARALRLLTDLERDQQAARQRADERARDAAMADRLANVRAVQILNAAPDHFLIAVPEHYEQEFAQAFADYGIDPSSGDVAALAARIRASPIAEALLVGLDAWGRDRRSAGRPTERWSALLDLADADPWRIRFRAAATVEEVRALARAADLEALPIQSLALLVSQLDSVVGREEALDFAIRVHARHPGNHWTLVQASYLAARCRPPRTEDSVRFATAALALQSESAESHAWMGIALRSAGDLPRAAVALREAVRRKPEFAWGHELLGGVLSEMGEHAEAVREGRESVRREPATASAHRNLGLTLLRSGDLDGALAHTREALDRNPLHFEAHMDLGRILEAKGDLPGAVAAYRKAAGLGFGPAEVRYASAGALLVLGDEAGAIAELREAVTLRPDWSAAHGRLGYALYQAGDHEGAIAALRETIRIGPATDRAHYLLGSALVEQGDIDRAIVEYREAVRLNPHHFKAHHNLGVSLGRIYDYEGAVAAFRDAVREAPSSAPAHLGLGRVLIFVGEFRRAAEALREAIRLQPDLQGAAELLQRAELFAALEARLDGVMSGRDAPSDAVDRVELAFVAFLTSRYAAAAALYALALLGDPRLAAEHGIDAACAAARAGAGQGKDATASSEAARAGWRRQAVARLRTALDLFAAWTQETDPVVRPSVVRDLERLQRDRNLAGIRESAAIASLPPDEQEACRALWRDVDALLAKARASK